MSVVGDERRRWLRVSEFDSNDLDFPVPELARAGIWDPSVDKCVNQRQPLREVTVSYNKLLTLSCCASGFFVSAPTAALLSLPRPSCRVSDG